MNFTTSNKSRAIFYLAWLIIALLQAAFTELQDDEAYYWVYSKFPAWGYFDHPPLTAMLIRAGYAILPNALGVRLFPLLLNTATIYLLEKMVDQKNKNIFFSIVISIAFLQVTGFMAVPDTPLLFFIALFFYCYRSFLQSVNLFKSLLLGLSIALMVYSKYHGILIVLFTIISNPSLLRNSYAWTAAIFALFLYSPHLYWQWDHQWVSVKYHLFESNVGSAYKPEYTLGFIGGIFLLAGPLIGILLLPLTFLYRPQSKFEKSFKWSLFGLYGFFFLSSIRGEVELNWTAPALVPLIILSCNAVTQRPVTRKWLIRLIPFSLILVTGIRIIMLFDIIPLPQVQQRFHAWKNWPERMKRETRGLPVVFSNSYQRASKYWFYTGQVTLSQNHVMDHRNNYNFWPVEEQLLGQPVYAMDIYPGNFTGYMQTGIGKIGYRYDSSFVSLSQVKFIPGKFNYQLHEGDQLNVETKITMPAAYSNYLQNHLSLITNPQLFLFKKRKIIKSIPLMIKLLTSNNTYLLQVNPQLPPGRYEMIFSLQTAGYNPTHNSEKISLTVK